MDVQRRGLEALVSLLAGIPWPQERETQQCGGDALGKQRGLASLRWVRSCCEERGQITNPGAAPAPRAARLVRRPWWGHTGLSGFLSSCCSLVGGPECSTQQPGSCCCPTLGLGSAAGPRGAEQPWMLTPNARPGA